MRTLLGKLASVVCLLPLAFILLVFSPLMVLLLLFYEEEPNDDWERRF